MFTQPSYLYSSHTNTPFTRTLTSPTMTSSEASDTSDASSQTGSVPPVDDSTHEAIAVRSDDWAAVLKFITAQDIVVSAAYPSHLYPLQADAKKQLKSLKHTINKYKYADDMVEVEVKLDGQARQKTLLSPKALSSKNEFSEASKVNNVIGKAVI